LDAGGCGTHPPAARDDAAGAPPEASHDASDASSDAAPVDRHEVLFVGNSFIFVNDVSGHYRAIASALFRAVRVEEVTAGGYRLAQHLEDARTDGTPLARWLRTGTPEETSFDAVVLQEQSQIGGLPTATKERAASIAAASALAALATARGARVVLYMTWGYEHGDPPNDLIGFATYEGMQDHLDEDYVALTALLREQGATVLLAPVGGGFRIVREDVTRAGGEPEAAGSDFDRLYEADGIHPSLRGAYLASCIIAGTITGAYVGGFVDEPTLGPTVSRDLRGVCARALSDRRWDVPAIRRPSAVLSGDGRMGDFFGAAVAMSADGTRVLVGAPATGSFSGVNTSARVFARDAARWPEEAVWRGNEATRGFAGSVALNGDGTRALVGPPTTVRVRSGVSWSEEATLPVSPWTRDGSALALSADGRRAVAGVASTPGAPETVARVFVQIGGQWVEEGVVRGSLTDWFSPMVAIDGTGERVIVGASPCRVAARTATGWIEEATLSVSGGAVALSSDGTRAVVGVEAEDRAVVFVRTGSSWREEATLRARCCRQFGAGVALSADGTRVLVGAPSDSPTATGGGTGSAWMFALRDGAFRQELLLVPRTLPGERVGHDHFGHSVALSAGGESAVVGGPALITPSGALYVGAAHVFTPP
jgi:hypothetical protein